MARMHLCAAQPAMHGLPVETARCALKPCHHGVVPQCGATVRGSRMVHRGVVASCCRHTCA